jgi:tetratricopeptide (TPR) repeat protein
LKLEETNNLEDQIEHYLKVVGSNPQDIWSLIRLGYTYTRANKFAEAVHAYKKALEVDPTMYFAHYGLGYSYMITQIMCRPFTGLAI